MTIIIIVILLLGAKIIFDKNPAVVNGTPEVFGCEQIKGVKLAQKNDGLYLKNNSLNILWGATDCTKQTSTWIRAGEQWRSYTSEVLKNENPSDLSMISALSSSCFKAYSPEMIFPGSSKKVSTKKTEELAGDGFLYKYSIDRKTARPEYCAFIED